MSLIKRSDWPSLVTGSWLSDFFDTDRYFDSDMMRRQSVPAVNVNETDNGFEIELAAPGFEKKDFSITVDNGVLTIASERKEKKEKSEKNYTRREFGHQSFSRSFSLPENVSQDDVKANYQDGILKLHLTKKEITTSKAKKAIEVR